MAGFHILIFDEDIGDGFFRVSDYPFSQQDNSTQGKKKSYSGSDENQLLSNLTLWANYKVHDLISHCYPADFPVTIFSLRQKDIVARLIDILNRSEMEENIIIGRTGNITAVEWTNLESRLKPYKGPLKIQVGKVPSDLYVVKRSYLRRVIKKAEHGAGNIIKWLFDTHLFYNFERIVDISGISFLMRNCYEYYRENMRIFDYMQLEAFLDLYGRLTPSSLKNSTVSENGVVRDTIMGSGVTLDGTIEHSVISNDVTVRRNAVIRNSVILDSNIIEEDVRIENTLLFEGNGRVVGNGSVIGSGREVENIVYPDTVKRGLTVIGRNMPVPPFSRIGAGCLMIDSENSPDGPVTVSDGEALNASH